MSTSTRPPLPRLTDELFLIDGGLETSLILNDRLDLPEVAAFGLPTVLGGCWGTDEGHLATIARTLRPVAG